MKVISVDIARTVWLFPLTELNPTGKGMTEVFHAFADRYRFKIFPKHHLDFDKENALTFDGGEFKNAEGVVVSVKFRLYNDGVVAECWSSTRDSDDLVNQTMEWLKTAHGLSLPPDRVARVLYVSQLIVTTDRHLATLNPKLEAFADLVSQKVAGARGDGTGYNVGGVIFWPDDTTKANAPGPFRFENKVGSLPSERRYFTQAPLPTDAHLELLDKLEAILS